MLAKAVANATAALVLKAKGVASKVEDQGMQNKVIGSATQCALATSQLVACTKVSNTTRRVDTIKRYLNWYRYHFKKYRILQFNSLMALLTILTTVKLVISYERLSRILK